MLGMSKSVLTPSAFLQKLSSSGSKKQQTSVLTSFKSGSMSLDFKHGISTSVVKVTPVNPQFFVPRGFEFASQVFKLQQQESLAVRIDSRSKEVIIQSKGFHCLDPFEKMEGWPHVIYGGPTSNVVSATLNFESYSRHLSRNGFGYVFSTDGLKSLTVNYNDKKIPLIIRHYCDESEIQFLPLFKGQSLCIPLENLRFTFKITFLESRPLFSHWQKW